MRNTSGFTQKRQARGGAHLGLHCNHRVPQVGTSQTEVSVCNGRVGQVGRSVGRSVGPSAVGWFASPVCAAGPSYSPWAGPWGGWGGPSVVYQYQWCACVWPHRPRTVSVCLRRSHCVRWKASVRPSHTARDPSLEKSGQHRTIWQDGSGGCYLKWAACDNLCETFDRSVMAVY